MHLPCITVWNEKVDNAVGRKRVKSALGDQIRGRLWRDR